jgi:epoxyqueuosine reductase QueG
LLSNKKGKNGYRKFSYITDVPGIMTSLLITEKGAAHRCGSFVVNLKLKPNREREKDIHAYCLQYQGVNCLKCQKRCPADAISEDGHCKQRYGKKVIESIPYCNKNYHIFIYGCGLCSTKIPCESGIPTRMINH